MEEVVHSQCIKASPIAKPTKRVSDLDETYGTVKQQQIVESIKNKAFQIGNKANDKFDFSASKKSSALKEMLLA